jgi:hypothetical protein
MPKLCTLYLTAPIFVASKPNRVTVTGARVDGKNIENFEDPTIVSVALDDVNYTTKQINSPVTVAENCPPQDDGTHRVSFFVEFDKPKWFPPSIMHRPTDGELVSKPIDQIANGHIQPSFYTIEEQWFGENSISNISSWKHERGNACCLEMVDPMFS